MKFVKTIQFRLLLFASLISLVPLLVLGGYNLKAARANLETSVWNHQAYVTQGIAADISSMLDEAKQTFLILARAEGLDFADKPLRERERILYACLTSLPYVDEISAIDKDGLELAQVSRFRLDTGDSFKLKNPEDIIKELEPMKPYISKVYMDEDKQPAFILAVPFLSSENRFTGAITAKISLRSIVQKISLVSGGKESIFLVDEEGRLIGHNDYSQVLRQPDISKSLPAVEVTPESSGERKPLVRNYQSYTGEQVVGSYLPIEGTEWAVILEEPEVYAYASFTKLKETFVLSTLGLVLLVLLISISFSLSFGRRLDSLRQGVLKIHEGEWGYTIPVKKEDEIGEVLHAFNELSVELEKKKQVEAAMMRADQMVTVGQLAAGVAHEINNPLAAIYLSVEEVLERLEEGDAEPQERQAMQRYLKTIAEQAERCSGITSQLLDFAHQSRQEDVQESLYNLNDLIQKNSGLLHYRFRKQQIELEENLEANLPLLLGDQSAIQQVIFNLICNALDAMPEGGTLKIETSSEDEWVSLRIQDEGIGIPEEHLTRIFEPFFTTKPTGKGTGLGLSVCYGLVQKAQGQIKIESTLGVGTIVTVRLPRRGEYYGKN